MNWLAYDFFHSFLTSISFFALFYFPSLYFLTISPEFSLPPQWASRLWDLRFYSMDVCHLNLLPIRGFKRVSFLRSLVNSAMPKCANGHPKTLPRPPLLSLPPAQRQASRYVSCAWTRRRSRAPAAVLQTSKREVTTRREAGSARRAGRHVSATLKEATTAATVPEARGGSSFASSGALPRTDAAPHREATGTLAKSRTSHLYRQSKNLTWKEKRCMNKYINIYTWIYI